MDQTNNIHPMQQAATLRLLAAALELQHLTSLAANVVPIPGGERVIAIGGPEAMLEVLTNRAARDVLAERRRQVETEGWTPERDDMHGDGQMAVAAGYYALSCGYPYERDIGHGGRTPAYWPWAPSWWKPKDKRSNLVKAGALILAEIERIDRAAGGDLVDSEGGRHD